MSTQNQGHEGTFTWSESMHGAGTGMTRHGHHHASPQLPPRSAHAGRFDATATEVHAVMLAPAGERRNQLALALWDAGLMVSVFAAPQDADGVIASGDVQLVIIDTALGLELPPRVAAWLRSSGRGNVRLLVVGEVDPAGQQVLSDAGVTWTVARPQHADVLAHQVAVAMGVKTKGWN